ncbi:unnamed protein product [Calicophoron daubneyi]|uniref:Virilizer N-terminal domain-containing protein n=1 Tax=Calicophoron daubneyi TaxID=300641 RepID=A0AAV2TYZ5_CALDB
MFFDTFTHHEQIKENFDCIRFKSGVEILEIRVLPFGAVVESNLSDEAVLGATNPASFDLNIYSNSQTNCVVLQKIAGHRFHEKDGVNCIFFKDSIHSNFLLFRGQYSTLTVAVFGLPALPLNQALQHGNPMSVPPPQMGLPIPVGGPASSVFQAAGENKGSFAPPTVTQSSPMTSMGTSKTVELDAPHTWTSENAPGTVGDVGPPQLTSDSQDLHPVNSETVVDLKPDENKPVSQEVGGLYEDGEIQDIDYEEISSNEELFSEIEEGDAAEDTKRSFEELDENDPRFAQCRWRFNPWGMALRGNTGSSDERLRIPDPTWTLFQVHCWILERTGRCDSGESEIKTKTDENYSESTSRPEVQSAESEDSIDMLPPPDDWPQAAESAQYLLSVSEKFPAHMATEFMDEWVEAMENIEPHLTSGLAFLSLTDKEAFQTVTEALTIWVYTGLDMSAALRQRNPNYIVRHLMTGVNLSGLVTGTTDPGLISSLLYPSCSRFCTLPEDTVHPEALQVQHLLLNLLESPLITTPLRLSIGRALDRTTRTPIGLDSFLGRPCPFKIEKNGGDIKELLLEADHDHTSEKGALNQDHRSPIEDFKPKPEPEPMRLEDSIDSEHLDVKQQPTGETDKVAEDLEVQAKKSRSEEPVLSFTGRTPYQRLVFLFGSCKNSRVTTAFQRLLNKLHAYELCLEFNEYTNRLRDSATRISGDSGDIDKPLQIGQELTRYITQISELWQNAGELIANPHSTLPNPMLLNEEKRCCFDPHPDLCSMLDATHVLDNVTWLVEQLQRQNQQNEKPLEWIQSLCTSDPPGESDSDVQSLYYPRFAPMTVDTALTNFISALISNVNGLVLWASRADVATRLIKACLMLPANPVESNAITRIHSDKTASKFFLIGLEMACKLDALHCVDLLVAWSRKKGMTGICSTISQLASEATDPGKSASLSSAEPLLHSALFGLASLSVSSIGLDTSGLLDRMKSDCSAVPPDLLGPIMSASAPTWMAEVISMDDFFVPLLMLLEAFTNQESSLSVPQPLSKSKSSEKLKETGEEEKESSTQLMADAPPTGVRGVLRNLLSNPLDMSSLCTVIVLNVLRHSDSVSYLDHYGPRLAQLVSNYTLESHLEDFSAIDIFTRLQSFSRSASPYLYWLRDFPSRVVSTTTSLMNLPVSSLLSSEAYGWLLNQLKPLCTELQDALDTLLDLETTDEISTPSANPTISTRKQLPNQGLIAGRSVPPSVLLLLRLIRAHVTGPKTSNLPTSCRYSSSIKPENQLILSRNLALIELYSANGLHWLTFIIEKVADYFLLQCQVSVSQASCSLDLINISGLNANASLLLSVIEVAVELVAQMLNAILCVQNREFRNMTPIPVLCRAYACAVYAVCPPGRKSEQCSRIREGVIAGLLAYASIESKSPLTIKEIESSSWVSVCREIISFTVASPVHYLPGLKILLDLLPLPLPIFTLKPLKIITQNQIRSCRDLWAAHLLGLASETAGLVELLGATYPSSSNPLYVHLLALVRRIADLGLPCAKFLATACLDSLITVWSELNQDALKKANTPAKSQNGQSDNMEKLNQPDLNNPNANDEDDVGDEDRNAVIKLRTPSARLLLLSGSSADQGPCLKDGGMGESPGGSHLKSKDVEMGGVQAGSAHVPVEMGDNETVPFAELADSTELTSALHLLHLNLSIPSCRYVIINLLSASQTERNPSNDGKAHEESNSRAADNNEPLDQMHSLMIIIDRILSSCSDKLCHVQTQLVLLKCIDLLVDTRLAFSGFSGDIPWTSRLNDTDFHIRCLAEGLPASCFTLSVIRSLIKHINHPDRDMVTLPSALHPLLLLTEHDHGFLLVREVLDSPLAETANGHHFFANMVQRVNDCFSAENPDCQATLAGCLRLLQSLLIGRTSLPLTFVPDEEEDTEETHSAVLRLRHLHISGARVRDLLGWSGGGDEGKPVRDLHALLEMLADDEPSLEFLRSGMKNLLSLLSEEIDVPGCDDMTPVFSLPDARTLEEIFSERHQFVVVTADAEGLLSNRLSSAFQHLSAEANAETVLAAQAIPASLPKCIQYNLADLAANCCDGLNIREELTKCGRQRDSAESAIRHQKRRRGQSSIIETGRSSKKFVAPMRGRGFILRGGLGHSASSGSGGSVLGGPNASGGGNSRLDPFRSRPLNTSRPPSLHVDDFTKLVKDENAIEEIPRPRPYRDGRGFRTCPGRGLRTLQGGRGNSGVSALSSVPFGLAVPTVSSLNPASLLSTWPASRSIPLLPFNLDPRSTSNRRDRPLR